MINYYSLMGHMACISGSYENTPSQTFILATTVKGTDRRTPHNVPLLGKTGYVNGHK